MISVDQSAETRRLHRVDGMSIRGISRRLRLERETTALSAPRVGSGVDERWGLQTRSGAVPTDFGDGMLAAPTALPLPTEEDIPDPRARRKAKLETLRAQALVHNLRATALRAGDVCRLTSADPKLADQVDSHLRIEMAEIAFAAHVVFGKDV